MITLAYYVSNIRSVINGVAGMKYSSFCLVHFKYSDLILFYPQHGDHGCGGNRCPPNACR